MAQSRDGQTRGALSRDRFISEPVFFYLFHIYHRCLFIRISCPVVVTHSDRRQLERRSERLDPEVPYFSQTKGRENPYDSTVDEQRQIGHWSAL
jgi:hypothetical protein